MSAVIISWFADEVTGKVVGKALIDKGVDIIFVAAARPEMAFSPRSRKLMVSMQSVAMSINLMTVLRVTEAI
jgi:hypothetical protein